MGHRHLKSFVFLAGCAVLWSTCAIASAADRASVPVAPQARPAPSADAGPSVCFTEVFAEPLPGRADYCRGLRDWNDGHYDSGLELLKLAAGWGNKGAQYTLGLIYYGGRHVPADTALGLAWLKLANERNNDAQIANVTRSAFKWATPADRQRADALFAQMQGTYGDKVAGARAWQRLQRWQSRHGDDAGCVPLHGAEALAAAKQGITVQAPTGSSPDVISVPNRTVIENAHQPIIGDPIWMRLKHSSAPPEPREARTLQQQRMQATGVVCVPAQAQRQWVSNAAEEYFRGLIGTVSVGPLQQVPANASSSTH